MTSMFIEPSGRRATVTNLSGEKIWWFGTECFHPVRSSTCIGSAGLSAAPVVRASATRVRVPKRMVHPFTAPLTAVRGT
ncbi:hypothetical protein [Streptomyces virginiae]|uniref:hypothetical protein n=1 Tax=Streptomyces virginiae TaxID=1961 RepID=UPI0035DBF8FE